MKKNSLESLLAIKALKEEKEKEPIKFVLSVEDNENDEANEAEEKKEGIVIELERISERKLYEITNGADKDTTAMEIYDQLIYEAIPKLRKPETLEEFDCKDNPISIVGKIFSLGDRYEMGVAIRESINNNMLERIKN